MSGPPNTFQARFPRLTPNNHVLTSPEDFAYNCIAWAAGDKGRFWWPQPVVPYLYWPQGVCREVARHCFVGAFATLGYQEAEALDWSWTAGVEKVVLYEDSSGTPTHAARQLPSGRWTSKLGRNVDIEHLQPEDVEGPAYGTAAVLLAR